MQHLEFEVQKTVTLSQTWGLGLSLMFKHKARLACIIFSALVIAQLVYESYVVQGAHRLTASLLPWPSSLGPWPSFDEQVSTIVGETVGLFASMLLLFLAMSAVLTAAWLQIGPVQRPGESLEFTRPQWLMRWLGLSCKSLLGMIILGLLVVMLMNLHPFIGLLFLAQIMMFPTLLVCYCDGHFLRAIKATLGLSYMRATQKRGVFLHFLALVSLTASLFGLQLVVEYLSGEVRWATSTLSPSLSVASTPGLSLHTDLGFVSTTVFRILLQSALFTVQIFLTYGFLELVNRLPSQPEPS